VEEDFFGDPSRKEGEMKMPKKTRSMSVVVFFLMLFGMWGNSVWSGEPTTEDMQQWIEQLGDDEFSVREKAYQKLLAVGKSDPERVLKVLPEQHDDLEIQNRCEQLRKELKGERETPPSQAQEIRGSGIFVFVSDASKKKEQPKAPTGTPIPEGKTIVVRLEQTPQGPRMIQEIVGAEKAVASKEENPPIEVERGDQEGTIRIRLRQAGTGTVEKKEESTKRVIPAGKILQVRMEETPEGPRMVWEWVEASTSKGK
jgi:hypothetical protein